MLRAALGAFLLLVGSSASAQDVTEPALKAAFIYNFAKFTEWPTEAPPGKEPFVLCVAGDAAVADALADAIKDRRLAGQDLRVSFVTPAESLTKCRLLYMSVMTTRQAATLVAGLRDAPVLTISDLEGFKGLGGIASFFFESGRLRFSVSLASAKRANLRISSRLLAMAIQR